MSVETLQPRIEINKWISKKTDLAVGGNQYFQVTARTVVFFLVLLVLKKRNEARNTVCLCVLQMFGAVRYSFIKIGMKLSPSSKTTFAKNHFHQKPLSSKTTFIKNHFHQKPFSSKTIFIRSHFHQNHFRQNPISSKTIFVKIPLSSSQTLNPKLKPQLLNPKPYMLNPKTANPKP